VRVPCFLWEASPRPRAVSIAERNRRHRRLPQRAGLTLVELILVLSLLVVIGAIAAPLLDGSFARARLWHGGDLLRAAWTRARLSAMESGQTQAMRVELRGGHYQLAVWDSVQAAAGQSPPLSAAPPATEEEPGFSGEFGNDCLPAGVVFATADIAPIMQLKSKPAAAVTEGWSPPILFYPDGTTSDASVLLANERELTLRVTLRGMTGVAQPSEVGQEALP
jgi:type II secretory pathway pseudopilin PulG